MSSTARSNASNDSRLMRARPSATSSSLASPTCSRRSGARATIFTPIQGDAGGVRAPGRKFETERVQARPYEAAGSRRRGADSLGVRYGAAGSWRLEQAEAPPPGLRGRTQLLLGPLVVAASPVPGPAFSRRARSIPDPAASPPQSLR